MGPGNRGALDRARNTGVAANAAGRSPPTSRRSATAADRKARYSTYARSTRVAMPEVLDLAALPGRRVLRHYKLFRSSARFGSGATGSQQLLREPLHVRPAAAFESSGTHCPNRPRHASEARAGIQGGAPGGARVQPDA